MDSVRPLYLMLSRTETSMGKIIRFFTGYHYNHVSLTLDPTFCRWVSFARYRRGVPLAGGFVVESPERLLSSGSISVRIFRLDIPVEKYRKLKLLFAQAGQSHSVLLYNSFGALVTPVGLHFPVKGAYTCLEFAEAILQESYGTISNLDRHHRADLIFEGDLQDLVFDSGSRSDSFFCHRGIIGGTLDTTWHFARLFGRLVYRRHPDPVTTALL